VTDGLGDSTNGGLDAETITAPTLPGATVGKGVGNGDAVEPTTTRGILHFDQPAAKPPLSKPESVSTSVELGAGVGDGVGTGVGVGAAGCMIVTPPNGLLFELFPLVLQAASPSPRAQSARNP